MPDAEGAGLVITGIGGLVGSTVALHFQRRGWRVSGCDDDSRGRWFGARGSTLGRLMHLRGHGIDARIGSSVLLTELIGPGTRAVIHCAAQPSHDYSRTHPVVDFTTNAMGTLTVLEAVRQLAPQASVVFLSTNKVYGDCVNRLDYVQSGSRYDLCDWRSWVSAQGVNELAPLDGVLRTPFGASKLAADILVQEWSRTYGLDTVVFRCGCITGAGGAAVELQGFLGHLVHCAVAGEPYTVYGHDGNQVRDTLDAEDLAHAIECWLDADPHSGVYNMGGGAATAISVNEAVSELRGLGYTMPMLSGPERLGDHKWWITDTSKFRSNYPGWRVTKGTKEIIRALVDGESSTRNTAAGSATVSAGFDAASGL